MNRAEALTKKPEELVGKLLRFEDGPEMAESKIVEGTIKAADDSYMEVEWHDSWPTSRVHRTSALIVEIV